MSRLTWWRQGFRLNMRAACHTRLGRVGRWLLLWVTLGWVWGGILPVHAQEPTYVRAEIQDVRYDADADLYRLSVSLDHPERVVTLIISIWDDRRGTSVGGDREFPNPDKIVVAELPAGELRLGGEYSIRVIGVDRFGNQLQLPPEDTHGRPVFTLAERKIVYDREEPQPVAARIDSVTPNHAEGILYIDLSVTDPPRVQSYEGFIVDATKARIANIGPAEFTALQLPVPLPPRMDRGPEDQKFRVTIYLTTLEGLRSEPAEYEVIVPAAIPLTWTERFNTWSQDVVVALQAQPLILFGVVLIALNLGGWLIFKNRRSQSTATLRGPHNLPTIFQIPTSPTAAPRLQLQVTKSPDARDCRTHQIQRFPCVLGRQGVDINIPGDHRISRRHAQISQSNGRFFLTDLDSRNHTMYNNSPLTPGQPVLLHSGGTVRLGTHTLLKVKIEA